MRPQLLGLLSLLTLYSAAQAVATGSKLSGTLLVLSSAGTPSPCSLVLRAYTLSSGKNSADSDAYKRFGCALEVAASSGGALVGSDLKQAVSSGYWSTYAYEERQNSIQRGNYFSDILISAAPNRPLTRLKAIRNAEGEPMLRGGLALSSDGSRIAFNSSTKEAGYPLGILVRSRNGDLIASFDDETDPAWMPDGRLVTVCDRAPFDSSGNAPLCLHDLKTKTVTALPELPKAAFPMPDDNDYFLTQPAVSPDGKHVAVTVEPNCSCTTPDTGFLGSLPRVWIFDVQNRRWSPALAWGSELDAVSRVEAPVWSPDSKVLAVSINNRLAFVDVGTRSLTGQASRASGTDLITRPVWIK